MVYSKKNYARFRKINQARKNKQGAKSTSKELPRRSPRIKEKSGSQQFAEQTGSQLARSLFTQAGKAGASYLGVPPQAIEALTAVGQKAYDSWSQGSSGIQDAQGSQSQGSQPGTSGLQGWLQKGTDILSPVSQTGSELFGSLLNTPTQNMDEAPMGDNGIQQTAAGQGGIGEMRPSEMIRDWEPNRNTTSIETDSVKTSHPFKLQAKAWKVNDSLDKGRIWNVIKFDISQCGTWVKNVLGRHTVLATENLSVGITGADTQRAGSQMFWRFKEMKISLNRYINPVKPSSGYGGQLGREGIRIVHGLCHDWGQRDSPDGESFFGREMLRNNAPDAYTMLGTADEHEANVETFVNQHDISWEEVGMDSKWDIDLFPKTWGRDTATSLFNTESALQTMYNGVDRQDFKKWTRWNSLQDLDNDAMFTNFAPVFLFRGINPDYWPLDIETLENANAVECVGTFHMEIETKGWNSNNSKITLENQMA